MGELDPAGMGALATSAMALMSAGGAYGKANSRLNRVQKDLESVEKELGEVQLDVADRLARIETKLDLALNR